MLVIKLSSKDLNFHLKLSYMFANSLQLCDEILHVKLFKYFAKLTTSLSSTNFAFAS